MSKPRNLGEAVIEQWRREAEAAPLAGDDPPPAPHVHGRECFADLGPAETITVEFNPTPLEQVHGVDSWADDGGADELTALRKEHARVLAELERRDLDRKEIRASREKIRKLESRVSQTKDAASAAKKALDAAMEDHLALEESLDSGQQSLPFPPAEPEPEAKPDPAPPPATEDDDAWKTLNVNALIPHGLPEGVKVRLQEAGILTLDDLARWSREHDGLRDIPGVGPAKQAQIEDATASFFQDWSLHRGSSGRDEDSDEAAFPAADEFDPDPDSAE